jgi:hypothetical protein
VSSSLQSELRWGEEGGGVYTALQVDLSGRSGAGTLALGGWWWCWCGCWWWCGAWCQVVWRGRGSLSRCAGCRLSLAVGGVVVTSGGPRVLLLGAPRVRRARWRTTAPSPGQRWGWCWCSLVRRSRGHVEGCAFWCASLQVGQQVELWCLIANSRAHLGAAESPYRRECSLRRRVPVIAFAGSVVCWG